MSLTEIFHAIDNGTTTCTTIVDQSLHAIDQTNSSVNAFVQVDTVGARARANMLDQQHAHGESCGVLHGIPIGIKDVFMQKGVRTTCCSKMLENYIAPFSATAVTKLEDAGAVIVGKTNMDEFAMGSTTRHSHFGACIHPFNCAVTPGGSSGGSAVAVASNMVPVALGTDTGGSVRQPAAMCGVVGIKPTYGRISRYGMIAYASSLDQCGVFGRTVHDCGIVLGALAGFDSKDATSSDQQVDNYTQFPDNCTGLRVGIASEFFVEGLDERLRQSLDTTITQLQSLGATIHQVHVPHFPQAIASYYVTATAEASSNLGRFDGVRYGLRSTSAEKLEQLYIQSRSEGFGNEVQRRIMLGVFVLSSGYYDAYYRKAQQIRRLLHNDFVAAFQHVDCLLAPVTPSPDIPADVGVDDPTKEYLADLYTVPVNMAGLPAISLPAKAVNNPEKTWGYACQIIAPWWQEAKLLGIAANLEKVIGNSE